MAQPCTNIGDGALSHKLDYIIKILVILDFKDHQNCIISSKDTAIFLNWSIIPLSCIWKGPFRMTRFGEYSVSSSSISQTKLEGLSGCIQACNIWLTVPDKVSFALHCFIAYLNTVYECPGMPISTLV